MKCRTCQSKIHLDPWGGKEEWTCLFCATSICVWCYHKHTKEKHPEAYVVGSERKRDDV